ncbi:retrotransposon protein, putative, Ty1-copia subclass [Cucumis melo var. makuwa]|uniref:Retrotransposon protein, putative, Ty1-copia subclass n=1 Tax=Cucumis melo var. makuwa TaxID=1194695 RepID=A0A5A7SY37_CUCMM|nr:retrotransposon protein, putative, Ty1-copia subclass [Cucumis melo var. makuwa]TYK31042.1 retrotransposon protein, putative, Ty1-copia subclass [Cucumis melo var. makuwa]
MEDQIGEEEEILISHNAKSVQSLDTVLIAASFDILQDQIHQDLDTGQVLLQGLLNDRLYKFTIQPSHKDFTILTPTQTFQKFKACVEKSLGQSIKSLQTDGGAEFKPFNHFLDQHGIEHRITCPYTSKQNDIVERKHRHIIEIGLTLLSQATLPLSFWDEAFSTSVYLINRLPTPVLDNISLLEKLFCRKPNFPSLRVCLGEGKSYGGKGL